MILSEELLNMMSQKYRCSESQQTYQIKHMLWCEPRLLHLGQGLTYRHVNHAIPGRYIGAWIESETIPRTPWVSEHWARARKKYVKAQRSISIWESSWAGFTEKLVSYCVCLGQEIRGGAEPSVWFKDPIVGWTQDSKHWICSIGQTIKHPQINDYSQQNAIEKLLLQNQAKWWQIANSWW